MLNIGWNLYVVWFYSQDFSFTLRLNRHWPISQSIEGTSSTFSYSKKIQIFAWVGVDAFRQCCPWPSTACDITGPGKNSGMILALDQILHLFLLVLSKEKVQLMAIPKCNQNAYGYRAARWETLASSFTRRFLPLPPSLPAFCLVLSIIYIEIGIYPDYFIAFIRRAVFTNLFRKIQWKTCNHFLLKRFLT